VNSGDSHGVRTYQMVLSGTKSLVQRSYDQTCAAVTAVEWSECVSLLGTDVFQFLTLPVAIPCGMLKNPPSSSSDSSFGEPAIVDECPFNK
jgi:hypothetical protein